MSHLSRTLIQFRKAHKLTQSQVAFKIGIARTTYNGYERDIILPPPDKLKKLADLYDVSIDRLYNEQQPLEGLNIGTQLELLIGDIMKAELVTCKGYAFTDDERKVIINKLKAVAKLGYAIASDTDVT